MLRQIIKRRGVAILDGGMGTALEQRGIEEPWSAGYRLDEPTVRKAVLDSYGSFLQAGADLLTVNTYNLSTPALANDFFSSGGDSSVLSQRRDALLKAAGDGGAKAAVANMFRANVEVARTAVAAHMAETTADGGGPLRVEPLLVASMGCYGTCIRGRAETANREGEAGADDAALLRVVNRWLRSWWGVSAGLRFGALQTIRTPRSRRSGAARLADEWGVVRWWRDVVDPALKGARGY